MVHSRQRWADGEWGLGLAPPRLGMKPGTPRVELLRHGPRVPGPTWLPDGLVSRRGIPFFSPSSSSALQTSASSSSSPRHPYSRGSMKMLICISLHAKPSTRCAHQRPLTPLLPGSSSAETDKTKIPSRAKGEKWKCGTAVRLGHSLRRSRSRVRPSKSQAERNDISRKI